MNKALKNRKITIFYLIEYCGYDGTFIEDCPNIKSLKKAIRKSNALDIDVIRGEKLKIEKSHKKRTSYWNRKKPTKIPELNIEIEGE